MLYIKKIESIEEIFNENDKFPKILKKIVYLFKKIFCILTIKPDGVCILPYKKLESNKIIKLIIKKISELSKNVVLSKELKKDVYFKNELENKKINVFIGSYLCNYLTYDYLEYISKYANIKTHNQEIAILINEMSEINKDNIIYLAKNLKRINIITENINKFKKLEKYLEELGISITITNNKKKSLLKSKIIFNIDFNEESINMFNINRNAIIININSKTNMNLKSFMGLNIIDYDINFNNDKFLKQYNKYKAFDKNDIYESIIYPNNNYKNVINQIKEDNIKIVNLIGKNGIINNKEYKMIYEKNV